MDPSRKNSIVRILGDLLQTSKIAKLLEIILLFVLVYIFIKIFSRFAGDNLVLNQSIVWVANILMLLWVWVGIRLRGDSWQDFGLGFNKINFREGIRVFLLSLLVFALAIAGFVLGSIIMANITGIPEEANFSGYDYLKNNLGMLFLTLIGVYIVSSFGEEVVYRAFLINRLQELGLEGRIGNIIAVTISAIIFGFAHYSWGPMGIVQTGFMGMALGLCYLFWQKRLWILILAHVYMDTILMLQMYLAS